MDGIEALLCPQVCMDVDDTPLELDNSKEDSKSDSDANEGGPSDDEKIQMLLDLENFDPAQTPNELSPDELNLMKTICPISDKGVQFAKIHCTACNVHLGSAPINQFERFIHPMLQVIVCKACYEFYCCGEFHKDEDGSELYCRWCGQGGNVICCSDCQYVFCKACIRRNLGRKTLTEIMASDDWKCFVCKPSQIVNIKVTSYALYQYTKMQVSSAKHQCYTYHLKRDLSNCCHTRRRRRKTSSSDDAYEPSKEEEASKKKKKKSIVNTVRQDNIPPPLLLKPPVMINNNLKPLPPLHPMPRPIKASGIPTKVNTPLFLFQQSSNAGGSQPILVCSSPQQISGLGQNAYPKVIHVKKSVLNNSVANKPGKPTFKTAALLHAVKVREAKNAAQRHVWFHKAKTSTNEITSKLNKFMELYTIERHNAVNLEHFATLHNKLQELLSSSVNNLIQVRKSLRYDFLRDLNVASREAKAKAAEDDVIIINNDEDDDSSASKENNELAFNKNSMEKTFSPGLIKVKPVSSINSSVLHDISTLKDPLCLSDDETPVLPNKSEIATSVEFVDVEQNEISTEEKPIEITTVIKKKEEVTTMQNNEEEMTDIISPDIDSETYRQIQRAIAESRFESLTQENMKFNVSGLSEEEKKRAINVRVNLNENFQQTPITHTDSEPLKAEFQDFEEMLSGTIVSKAGTTTTENFDNVFSQFLDDDTENDNGKCDNNVESEPSDESNSNKFINSSNVNHVSMTDDLCRQLESLQNYENNKTFNEIQTNTSAV